VEPVHHPRHHQLSFAAPGAQEHTRLGVAPDPGCGTIDRMTHPAVPTDAATLPSGAAMPLLGFGTWQLKGSTAVEATTAALDAGYRHLDTATIYGNEREVGRALAGRDDVFVTTKLPPDRGEEARETLEQSLEALGLDQVSLWLVHWPPDSGAGVEVWEAFVQAQADGLARDIGVSNYSFDQLDALTKATGVQPAVNQVKWSPLLHDARRAEGHRTRGVVLEGYSGLKGGTLDHPVITGIAERLGRTPAQVVVRWHLEHGFVVIPKSSNPGRIAANADVGAFALSPDDIATLDALGR
jgi:diketogulonate reductase-like aldo/keto reductase